MPKSALVCRCITLHTYPVSVTHDAWHVVTHICECGRVHFEEPIPEPPPRIKREAKQPRVRTPRRRAS